MISMLTIMLAGVPIAALAPIAFGAALAGALVWAQRSVRRAVGRVAAGAGVMTTAGRRSHDAATTAVEFKRAA